MSKASQYADALVALRKAPRFEIHINGEISDKKYTDTTEVARITDFGFLRLNDDEINPEQALRLASWIFEHFGE